MLRQVESRILTACRDLSTGHAESKKSRFSSRIAPAKTRERPRFRTSRRLAVRAAVSRATSVILATLGTGARGQNANFGHNPTQPGNGTRSVPATYGQTGFIGFWFAGLEGPG